MSHIEFKDEPVAGETVARPSTASGSKLMAVLLGTAALGAVAYAWHLNSSGSGAIKPEGSESFNTARADGDFGFREAPASKSDNRLVLPPVPPAAPPPMPIVAPTMPVIVDDSEARRRAEEERLRREAEARELARLRSTMIVVDAGAGSGTGGGSLTGGGTGPVRVQGQEEDGNRRFLASMASQDVETARATKIARIDALIPQGTMIRGVLETAIQSDLPGMVRAMTTEDVYSFDGRRILIPKATMLTGEYRSGITRGQTRVFIVWTRMLRADGVSVSLGSFGTDSLGRAGLGGVVDNHYVERFGSAILLSIVGGASSFLAGLNSAGQSVTAGQGQSTALQAQTQAQQTVSQTMSDLANQALRDSISIPPTIHVDQGARIVIFVRRDLDFSQLYADPVREALNELRGRRKAVQ